MEAPQQEQPTGAATWNPALRQNNNSSSTALSQEEDDDFFERYPGATPKKNAQQPPPSSSQALNAADTASPIRRRSISVQYEVDVRQEAATPDELRRVPSNTVDIGGPFRPPETGFEEEDEEELLRAEDGVEMQREVLQGRMPDGELGRDVEGAQLGFEDDEEDGMRQAEHYEHQGEVTEMEEAIEPRADVPLIQDEEPLPTPGFVSREPTMHIPNDDDPLGLDGEVAPLQPHAKSSAAHPQLNRSFTTNFSESPVEPRQPQQQLGQSIPNDWPSVGDDKTFGDLLDDQRTPMAEDRVALEQVASREAARIASPDQPDQEWAAFEHQAAQESAQIAALDDDDDGELLPEDEGEVKEEDLAAAWGALAEDDDELLEDTPTDLDPSNFFGEGDDGGFLNDEPALPQQQQQQRSIPSTRNQYQQTPTTTQFFGGHGRSADTPSTGLSDLYNMSPPQQQAAQFAPQQQQPQRPGLTESQSFVDKAKGGYQSPYDLPMEVVKPRRRPQTMQSMQSQQQAVQTPPPPPSGASPAMGHGPTPSLSQRGPPGAPPLRSSSINSTSQAAAGQTMDQRRPTGGSAGSLSPPQSSGSGAMPTKVTSTPKTAGGFFEDLPMTAKPRARPTAAYTPGVAGMPTPPPQPSSRQNTGPYTPGQQPVQGLAVQTPPITQQQQQQHAMFGGLTRPEQMPLIPNQPFSQPQPPPAQQPPHAQNARYSPTSQQIPAPTAPPVISSRYSPAPTQAATSSAAPSRYSPAPGSAPKPRNPSLPNNAAAGTGVRPFAPRTSSPLASMHVHTEKPLPASPPRVNGAQQQVNRYAPAADGMPQQVPQGMEPPVTFPIPTAASASYAAAPPQRPRTQSPDATMKQARAAMPRPSSSGVIQLPKNQPQQQSQTSASQPRRPALPHRRQFSRELTFAAPQDERSLDPLQRWKGCPIFSWSASGTVLTTFPKQTPFYAAGQGIPSVKCTPGNITTQDASAFMPMEDRNSKFPGPLTARSKRQKKDILTWLSSKISDLERVTEGAMLDFSLPLEVRKRTEEKLVLWKLIYIFLENDGVLEGSSKIEDEVRNVLLPNLAQMAQVADLQSPVSAAAMPDPVDKQVLFQIRQALLEGHRERAVWLAEEKKLWGHAMLIASTMGPETWKQIVQSFVRSQVKSVGSDARSTAALYQVFAGNAEECVDELVPPSARAGFQMISKVDGSVAGNPLEGLDQWRESLGLIVGNRTSGDAGSLMALGRLLAGYGRVEAGCCCFLFARAGTKVSGADDAEADWTLLGADGKTGQEVVGSDLDSILLTEIYEYASSLSAPANSPLYIPHLQAYKLLHAQQLAAFGLKTQAQVYVDAITNAYTSTTRPSPYYHPTFTQAVADFGAFLAQSPHDGKGGKLFSRPAMNKVSSSAAGWFTKFVAGEDDAESTASGGVGSDGGAGPFGGVNGESPGNISRSGSGTELYQPLSGGGMGGMGMQQQQQQQPAFAPSSAPGRYAPGGGGGVRYTPSSSSLAATAAAQPYAGLGIPAAEPQRPSSSRYAPAPSGGLGVPGRSISRRTSEQSLPYAPSSRRGSAQDTTSSQGSYEPRPILADEGSAYSYSPAVGSPLVQAHGVGAQEYIGVEGLEAVGQSLQAAQDDQAAVDAETGGYAPPTATGYESGGYEPPSYSTYQPYEPEPDSPEEERKPKKMTLGDEDDGGAFTQRPASLKKSQADRAADDAFRKAAEADAARDKALAEQKKGWLTGWFGGRKDANASPGPIKAKLGEQNQFYFDKDLGKWVNKAAGAEAATPAAATPPPPRGPPGRTMSAGMHPPPSFSSGPPSRASSGMGPPPPPGGAVRPPTSGSGPGFPGSGPPSRTGTPASLPSSEPGAPPMDLNGDAASPPGIATIAAPPMRPSSSLSTASSIDDLLAGPPGPRKGGTVKGKKKGGRYIDVMAK